MNQRVCHILHAAVVMIHIYQHKKIRDRLVTPKDLSVNMDQTGVIIQCSEEVTAPVMLERQIILSTRGWKSIKVTLHQYPASEIQGTSLIITRSMFLTESLSGSAEMLQSPYISSLT